MRSDFFMEYNFNFRGDPQLAMVFSPDILIHHDSRYNDKCFMRDSIFLELEEMLKVYKQCNGDCVERQYIRMRENESKLYIEIFNDSQLKPPIDSEIVEE